MYSEVLDLLIVVYYFTLFTLSSVIPITIYFSYQLLKHHHTPLLLLSNSQPYHTSTIFDIFIIGFITMLANFVGVIIFFFLIDIVAGQPVTEADFDLLVLAINIFFIIISIGMVYDLYAWILGHIYDPEIKLDYDTANMELRKKIQQAMIGNGIFALFFSAGIFGLSKLLISY